MFRPFHRISVFAFALAFAGSLPVTAHADEEASIRKIVESIVAPLMARNGIPGMAVGVTRSRRSYIVNLGVASKSTGTPVADDTIFEIGSLSKTLTATLATYAEATGKLSLADTPGKFAPALRGTPIDRVTLLQLGTYTAGGLPLQFPDAVVDSDAITAWYRQWAPSAPAGTQRQYSNPSLGLFGLAASNALGQPFASAMEDVVFPAFGMASTFITVPQAAMARYAWGDRDGKPVRVNPGPLDAQAYGVKTTAADFLRFIEANLDPSGLQAPMRQAVLRTQVGFYRAGPLVQGLGWEQYSDPVTRETLLRGNAAEMASAPQPAQIVVPGTQPVARVFNKTGSTGGFGAYALFMPAEKMGVVLLANKNYPNAERVEAGFAILQQMKNF